MRELEHPYTHLSETNYKQSIRMLNKDSQPLMKVTIEKLEAELQLKTGALILSQKEQTLLRKRLKICVENIKSYSKQIADIRNNLKDDFKLILERIESLEQEIKVLEHSNEAWSNRAIGLQFHVLTAQDEVKKVNAERVAALNKISILERELTTVKKENNKFKIQDSRVLTVSQLPYCLDAKPR